MFIASSSCFKGLSTFLLCVYCLGNFGISDVYAAIADLPQPGSMVQLSVQESVPLLKGLRFDQNDPLNINFVIEKANDAKVSQSEATKLINYFLTALTVAEEDIWVNLSPYESDRVMDVELAETELGQELLEQDYILKQLSASLTHPDTETGADYWKSMQGRTHGNAPTDTLGKIWIMPNAVEIYEGNNAAYVTKATMKVESEIETSDILLSKITEDVNDGQNFAKLRQVYNAIILANWFKAKFKKSFYSFYFDSEKTKGLDIAEEKAKEKVYNMYVEAFKKGAYDFIKKEYDTNINRKVKKHYFSGGVLAPKHANSSINNNITSISSSSVQVVTVRNRLAYNGDEDTSSTLKVKEEELINFTDIIVNTSVHSEYVTSGLKMLFVLHQITQQDEQPNEEVLINAVESIYKNEKFAYEIKSFIVLKKALENLRNFYSQFAEERDTNKLMVLLDKKIASSTIIKNPNSASEDVLRAKKIELFRLRNGTKVAVLMNEALRDHRAYVENIHNKNAEKLRKKTEKSIYKVNNLLTTYFNTEDLMRVTKSGIFYRLQDEMIYREYMNIVGGDYQNTFIKALSFDKTAANFLTDIIRSHKSPNFSRAVKAEAFVRVINKGGVFADAELEQYAIDTIATNWSYAKANASKEKLEDNKKTAASSIKNKHEKHLERVMNVIEGAATTYRRGQAVLDLKEYLDIVMKKKANIDSSMLARALDYLVIPNLPEYIVKNMSINYQFYTDLYDYYKPFVAEGTADVVINKVLMKLFELSPGHGEASDIAYRKAIDFLGLSHMSVSGIYKEQVSIENKIQLLIKECDDESLLNEELYKQVVTHGFLFAENQLIKINELVRETNDKGEYMSAVRDINRNLLEVAQKGEELNQDILLKAVNARNMNFYIKNVEVDPETTKEVYQQLYVYYKQFVGDFEESRLLTVLAEKLKTSSTLGEVQDILMNRAPQFRNRSADFDKELVEWSNNLYLPHNTLDQLGKFHDIKTDFMDMIKHVLDYKIVLSDQKLSKVAYQLLELRRNMDIRKIEELLFEESEYDLIFDYLTKIVAPKQRSELVDTMVELFAQEFGYAEKTYELVIRLLENTKKVMKVTLPHKILIGHDLYRIVYKSQSYNDDNQARLRKAYQKASSSTLRVTAEQKALVEATVDMLKSDDPQEGIFWLFEIGFENYEDILNEPSIRKALRDITSNTEHNMVVEDTIALMPSFNLTSQQIEDMADLGFVSSAVKKVFVQKSHDVIDGGIAFDGIVGEIEMAEGSSGIMLPLELVKNVTGIRYEIVDSYDVDDVTTLYAKRWK